MYTSEGLSHMLSALWKKKCVGVDTEKTDSNKANHSQCQKDNLGFCGKNNFLPRKPVCLLPTKHHGAVPPIHQDLPVNVKFVIEGMEETGSNGLDAMIMAQRDTFFSEVDYIIISDCGWLSRRPALTYGTRGNCYFFAEVVY